MEHKWQHVDTDLDLGWNIDIDESHSSLLTGETAFFSQKEAGIGHRRLRHLNEQSVNTLRNRESYQSYLGRENMPL